MSYDTAMPSDKNVCMMTSLSLMSSCAIVILCIPLLALYTKKSCMLAPKRDIPYKQLHVHAWVHSNCLGVAMCKILQPSNLCCTSTFPQVLRSTWRRSTLANSYIFVGHAYGPGVTVFNIHYSTCLLDMIILSK